MKINRTICKGAIHRGADWLITSAQIKDRANPYDGAFRTEYNTKTREWSLFEPIWHSGQDIKALLCAYRLGRARKYLQSTIMAGAFIRRHQVLAQDKRLHGVITGYITPDSRETCVATMIESLPGLLELHRITGDSVWLNSSILAAEWIIRNAYKGNGMIYWKYDHIKRKIIHNPWEGSREGGYKQKYLVPPDDAAPLIDDAVFYRLYCATKRKKYLAIFHELADRIYQEQNPPGCWVRYPASNPYTGMIQTRASWWWGNPLIHAYRVFREQRYLATAVDCADRCLQVQNLDGGLFSHYRTDGRHDSFGICGSSTAVVVMLWLDLWDVTKDRKYLTAARKGIEFLLKTQFSPEYPDETLRGAFFESASFYEGGGGHWHNVRDIATGFGIQALYKALKTKTMF